MTVLDDSDEEIDSNTCDSSSCEVDNLGLDDGEYTVEAASYDTIGNNDNDDWSFTVDTSYDGPEDFSFDPSPDVINIEDSSDREIDVETEEDNDDTDLDVECRINDDDVDSFTIDSNDDAGDETYTCDISDDYEDETFNLELYIEDQATNEFTFESDEFGFDASAPSISELESITGVSVFNEDFEMSYEAFDSVSGVDYIDYSVGDGDESQLEDSSGNFTVDTSDLEQGSYEVQAQAVDNVGKVSDERTFEFDFYPDEVPELTLEGETELNVTSGSDTTLELDLENTGRLLVPEGKVSGSEDFVESASYGNVAPGESETLDIVFSPENGLGEYTVDLQASTVDASHSVDVLVRADSSEQDEIDEEVQNYRSNLDDLNSRVEQLRPSLAQERKDRIDSDYEEFQSQVTEAEQAVEEGRYYEADEILSNLNTSRQSAESTFETVKSEHETAMRNRYILAGLFLVLLLIGGGAGFVLYSDEYEIDIESLSDLSIGGEGDSEDEEETDSGYSGQGEDEEGSKSAIDRIKDRVDDLRNGEEENEPEYEFK
ncbi:MAG: hypothetical protein R6V35_02635 [Candidatus Nanohaloarchaea archaeon]